MYTLSDEKKMFRTTVGIKYELFKYPCMYIPLCLCVCGIFYLAAAVARSSNKTLPRVSKKFSDRIAMVCHSANSHLRAKKEAHVIWPSLTNLICGYENIYHLRLLASLSSHTHKSSEFFRLFRMNGECLNCISHSSTCKCPKSEVKSKWLT